MSTQPEPKTQLQQMIDERENARNASLMLRKWQQQEERLKNPLGLNRAVITQRTLEYLSEHRVFPSPTFGLMRSLM